MNTPEIEVANSETLIDPTAQAVASTDCLDADLPITATTPAKALPPKALFIVERYIRQTRSMGAGTVLSTLELAKRIISAQRHALSHHTPCTPGNVRDIIEDVLRTRFDEEEILFAEETGELLIIGRLD